MVKIRSDECRAGCNIYVDAVDAGGAGTLQIFDGTVPANTSVAPTNPALVTINCPNPAFGEAFDDVTGGRADMNALPQSVPADNDHDGGGATFFRFIGGDSIAKIQGTVGTSGAELNLNDVNIVAGALVSITSFYLIDPLG